MLVVYKTDPLQKTEDVLILNLQKCRHQGHSFWLKYAPNCSAAVARPRPYWGAHSAPPKPLAGKGEGKEGKGREGNGTGRGGKREEVASS